MDDVENVENVENVETQPQMTFETLRDSLISLVQEGYNAGLKTDEVLAAVFVAYKMAEGNFDAAMRKVLAE